MYKKEQITCNQDCGQLYQQKKKDSDQLPQQDPNNAYTGRISNQSREGRGLLVLPWLIGSALREKEKRISRYAGSKANMKAME